MSTQPLKNLGLPQVPPGLKAILGFMQRADELKSQEPIVAYWALYHAAQVGISARTKDPAAKAYLSPLLTLLEDMKKEIGPNDAIANEVVAAAHVENFALKVFEKVDEEDRAGKATRGTAKKFLAAANLLELLQVFDKANVSDPTEEKIRYAKWKAADIAKAFREGRKPIPGPADQDEPDSPGPNITIEAATPVQPIPADPTEGLPVPPSRFDFDPTSPGNRSTVATPGTADHRALDSPISPPTGGPRSATVSDELEGPLFSPEDSSLGDPNIRRPTQSSPELPPQPSESGPFQPFGTVPSNTESQTTSQPDIRSFEQISHPPPSPPILTQPQPAPVISPPPTGPSASPPAQLTPKEIAQVQKHCRYAITALDYEDFERAKQDLLDALKMMEG